MLSSVISIPGILIQFNFLHHDMYTYIDTSICSNNGLNTINELKRPSNNNNAKSSSARFKATTSHSDLSQQQDMSKHLKKLPGSSGGANLKSESASSATTTHHLTSQWEGPPAHFMLPTHSISCRSSRSVERCPKACKGKTSIISVVLVV